jgi:hypothetical protein
MQARKSTGDDLDDEVAGCCNLFPPSTSKETDPHPPYRQKDNLPFMEEEDMKVLGNGGRVMVCISSRDKTWFLFIDMSRHFSCTEHDPGMSQTDGWRQFAQP